MNSNVYVLTFIFISLENVAGCSPSRPETPRQEQQPAIEKPEDSHDFKGILNFSCASQELYHKWYQRDQNGNISIFNIPPQKGVKTTRFIIKLEEFDNYTEIYCVNTTSKEKTRHTLVHRSYILTFFDKILSFVNTASNRHINSELHKTLIKIKANETCKENENRTILQYNEKHKVSFSCLEHNEYINKTAYIVLGLLNTTNNMIKTYEANSTNKIFDKTQNGTILCCVYYVVSVTTQEKWITRYVANKTLLLYNDTLQQNALKGQEITDSGHPTIIIIIITSALAVAFIMLVIIVICRKRSRKKPELNPNVLYADLDLIRQIEPDRFPRPGPEEESPYAQIIGEVRAQTK